MIVSEEQPSRRTAGQLLVGGKRMAVEAVRDKAVVLGGGGWGDRRLRLIWRRKELENSWMFLFGASLEVTCH